MPIDINKGYYSEAVPREQSRSRLADNAGDLNPT